MTISNATHYIDMCLPLQNVAFCVELVEVLIATLDMASILASTSNQPAEVCVASTC